MFQTNAVEKIKTFSVTFLRKSWRLLNNVEKHSRDGEATDDSIVWRMRCTCWIIKATNTLTISNTYCLSTATVVTRTRHSVTLHVHCLSCLKDVHVNVRVSEHVICVEKVRRANFRYVWCCDRFLSLVLWSTKLAKCWFLVLGFLHGVRGEFSDDVSGAAVGLEASWGQFTSHTVQKP